MHTLIWTSYPLTVLTDFKFWWEPEPMWVGWDLVKIGAVLRLSYPFQQGGGWISGLCRRRNAGPGLPACQRRVPAQSWDMGQRKGSCWHQCKDFCVSEGWELRSLRVIHNRCMKQNWVKLIKLKINWACCFFHWTFLTSFFQLFC